MIVDHEYVSYVIEKARCAEKVIRVGQLLFGKSVALNTRPLRNAP